MQEGGEVSKWSVSGFVLTLWRLSGWNTCRCLQLYGPQIICCTERMVSVFLHLLSSQVFTSQKHRAGGNSPQRKFLREVEDLLLSKYDKLRLMFEHPIVALAIMYLKFVVQFVH